MVSVGRSVRSYVCADLLSAREGSPSKGGVHLHPPYPPPGSATAASTWTVQNSLDNADAGRPLAQDCPAQLVDSPTGHYTNTGMHSSSLWLFFLAIVQQG